MSIHKPFLKSAGIVGLITLASRMLGMVRDMALAACFGASRSGDIFLIAFELPNLTRRILGEGSLSAFIVPVFSKVRTDEGKEESWRFASNALTTLGFFSLILTALGILGARWLFSIFGYGYVERGDLEAVQMGATLTRIMFPFMALLAVSSILMGLCHSLRRFTTPALGSITLNITMIGVSAIFWKSAASGEEGAWLFARWLAVAVLLGAFLRMLLMVPTLHGEGFRYTPRLRPDTRRMRRLYGMMLPAFFGLAVVQINISVSRAFATWLGEGFVPCLVFSNRLVQLPLAIIAASMATAILPQLTQYTIEDKKDELRALARFAFRLTFILFMPATVGLMALGRPLIQLLFERNQWDAEGTTNTTIALLYYAPALVAWGMLRIVTPIFYARHDVRTPVVAAAAAMVLNIALNVLLVFVRPIRESLGLGGLALSNTLGVFLNTGLLFYILGRRGLNIWDKSLTLAGLQTLLAALVMGAAVHTGWRYLGPFAGDSILLRAGLLGLLITVGGGIYFATALLLRLQDVRQALSLLARRGRKKPAPPSS
jgi:putative peptidoglycan lipid II flippase